MTNNRAKQSKKENVLTYKNVKSVKGWKIYSFLLFERICHEQTQHYEFGFISVNHKSMIYIHFTCLYEQHNCGGNFLLYSSIHSQSLGDLSSYFSSSSSTLTTIRKCKRGKKISKFMELTLNSLLLQVKGIRML